MNELHQTSRCVGQYLFVSISVHLQLYKIGKFQCSKCPCLGPGYTLGADLPLAWVGGQDGD